MIYENRITPENITELKDNEIFVYGANLKFKHNAGAAHTALQWGAKDGLGFFQYQTYGIPTKDETILFTLPLLYIKQYINDFIIFANEHKDLIFLVTPIGCGHAELTPNDIAPLFKKAIPVENIYLPLSFWKILIK